MTTPIGQLLPFLLIGWTIGCHEEALLAASSAKNHSERGASPNVLLVIADQWRAQAFGFAGDLNAKTPHLDRFANSSSRFINAVAGLPVCSPTRASLLTGQRPLTTGVFVNDVPLNPGVLTLAKVLKAAGYDTGYIGKWHLNGDGRSNFIPRARRQGFDYWKVLECTHDYNRSYYYGDGPEKLVWDGYDAIAQTRDAKEFLENHATTGKPFVLVLAWGPPHDPYHTAPTNYQTMYRSQAITLRSNVPVSLEKIVRERVPGYYAHCSALDDCFGDLWDTLHKTNLEKDTLLIFTSDHGDLLGSHGAWNKQQPYDESIRVPFLIHWPAGLGIKPRQLEPPLNSEDIMPTILGLCRITIPKSVEGIDYSTYLRGGRNPSDNATLISCVAPFGQWTRKMGGREYRGVRTVKYTYVRDLNGPWLLFDNERDPFQMNNLIGQRDATKLQKNLDSLLKRKLTKAHDQFLPAEEYVRQWGYTTDKNGTVPYSP